MLEKENDQINYESWPCAFPGHTFERARERGLVSRETKKKRSQKWNILRKNRVIEIGWLKESELASEGKYWKCIVNKDLKLAIEKDIGRTGIECRFWSRAAKISLKTSYILCN